MLSADRLKAKIAELEEQIAEFRRQAEQQLAALQGRMMALQELLDELEGKDEDDADGDPSGDGGA